MAERIGRERVLREPGYLYYLGKDGYLWKTPTKLNPMGQKIRVGSERITREDGYMYFLDKTGFVARARMKDVTPSRTPEVRRAVVHGDAPGAPGRSVAYAPPPHIVLRCRTCRSVYPENLPQCPRCGAPS